MRFSDLTRFLFRGALWVYLAWFAGFALAAWATDGPDRTAHTVSALIGVVALVSEHMANGKRRRIRHGDDS